MKKDRNKIRSTEQLLAYPCMWLIGVAHAARLWRHYTEASRGRMAENTTMKHESANPIRILSSSCNVESCGLLLLYVACVRHELHARKIRDPRCYDENKWG